MFHSDSEQRTPSLMKRQSRYEMMVDLNQQRKGTSLVPREAEATEGSDVAWRVSGGPLTWAQNS